MTRFVKKIQIPKYTKVIKAPFFWIFLFFEFYFLRVCKIDSQYLLLVNNLVQSFKLRKTPILHLISQFGNFVETQNFHNRKLVEISLFYVVLIVLQQDFYGLYCDIRMHLGNTFLLCNQHGLFLQLVQFSVRKVELTLHKNKVFH